MASYRFCRPDDMRLLITAINNCCLTHQPEAPSITEADYRSLVRGQNLWASSCLIATETDATDVVAACIGCKRHHATLIYMIGSRPDRLRKGHAAHMLDSLSKKLAILGPPQLLAEVPTDSAPANALFKQLGYQQTQQFTDFVYRGAKTDGPEKIPVENITLDDILKMQLFDTKLERSWTRQLETLKNFDQQLSGIAIVSDRQVESYLLYLLQNGVANILAVGGANDSERSANCRGLLHHFCRSQESLVKLPRLSEAELPFQPLAELGFEQQRSYYQYSNFASPD